MNMIKLAEEIISGRRITRQDMAVSLAELGIDSIPINALMTIPGTPLAHLLPLPETC